VKTLESLNTSSQMTPRNPRLISSAILRVLLRTVRKLEAMSLDL
jgi:hypothetical protein